ncbi:hypothetical protein [Acinetobacter seifertii]|uniref:hypothetical protein n=1 Tax=Acinetobacter seifertii TaxID=1530123 RepID=UPI00125026F2|nr:hypothetical protein [Acinetobacter seifertii]
MKKHSIEFLRTACLIRTKQFIDQEFERYSFMHRYQKQLNDLNELNQVIVERMSKDFTFDSEFLDQHPEIKFAANFMKFDSKKFFELELLAGFWGIQQYQSDFKVPILNFFQMILTQKFKNSAFQTWSFIRGHKEYNQLFESAFSLRDIYDLAALSFRMQFDPLKFLMPLCLEFHTTFFRLRFQQESLIHYHALINFLTPLDTLRKDQNKVWAQPKNKLAQRVLNGEEVDESAATIPEIKLTFQVTLDKGFSFYDAMYFSLLDVHNILGRQLSEGDLERIPLQLEQLSDTIEFLSDKTTYADTRHPKEKSLTVSFQSLILYYFKKFKETEFCTNRSMSLPNGFNQFLYDLLNVKEQKKLHHYKLNPAKHLNNTKKIYILYVSDIEILSFSYDPIKKALENRIKDVDLPQIIRQPNFQTEVIDLPSLIKSEKDFPFVER